MCYNNPMRYTLPFPLLTLVLLLVSCGQQPPPADPAYRAKIETAWADREERLTADDGWLTLTGLYWLEPGPNLVGTADEAAVRLPEGGEVVGSIHLGPDRVVTLLPAPGVDLTVNGEPAAEQELASDTDGSPDLMRAGRTRFYLIARGDRIGVRVKDPEAPTRREFPGL